MKNNAFGMIAAVLLVACGVGAVLFFADSAPNIIIIVALLAVSGVSMVLGQKRLRDAKRDTEARRERRRQRKKRDDDRFI